MKRTILLSVFLATTIFATSPALAMRDPIGYADGMSLYEYAESRPSAGRDASGLSSSQDLGVRLEVKEQEGNGGSIEVWTDHTKRTVDAMGAQSTPSVDVLYALTRWWENVQTHMALFTSENPTSFYARLEVSVSASRPRRWQICPSYRWHLTVHNTCCESGNISVVSRVSKGSRAYARAPARGPVYVGKGDSKDLGEVVVEIKVPAIGGRLVAQKFASSASAGVRVICIH